KALDSAAVEKPAYCRIVHGWLTYIDGYGPRTYGMAPGTVSSGKGVTASSSSVVAVPASTASRSALVETRLTSIRSGVSLSWASAGRARLSSWEAVARGAAPRSGAVLQSGKGVGSLVSQLGEEGGQGRDAVVAQPEVNVVPL